MRRESDKGDCAESTSMQREKTSKREVERFTEGLLKGDPRMEIGGEKLASEKSATRTGRTKRESSLISGRTKRKKKKVWRHQKGVVAVQRKNSEGEGESGRINTTWTSPAYLSTCFRSGRKVSFAISATKKEREKVHKGKGINKGRVVSTIWEKGPPSGIRFGSRFKTLKRQQWRHSIPKPGRK